ncbi:hypothetical protein FRC07_004825 [Ceratobasidium sp. 392]|nr:hypothetical protein FRC07_004825 [Ceratobasidium sp. 392]
MHCRFFTTILLAATTAATPVYQRQGQGSGLNLTGLIDTLNQQGLTTFTTALTQYASTQQGQQDANNFQNGNYTILAPTNQALDPVLPTLGNDTNALGTILSYHILNGSYGASSIAPARSHSIAPTFLTNNTYVNLGGSPQVQVLERSTDGNRIVIRRTTGNATVTNSTTYQSFTIHSVDSVLMPPGDLKAALSTGLVSRAPGGFTGFGGSLQKVGQLDNANNAANSTFFVPIDEAFAAVNSTTSGLSNDQLNNILQNHIVNNNVIYSPQLNSSSAVNAASGAQLNFTTDNGVSYVNYNQTRARILRSDVAVKNGVVHVIDAVLA